MIGMLIERLLWFATLCNCARKYVEFQNEYIAVIRHVVIESFYLRWLTPSVARLNVSTEHTRLDFYERDERAKLDSRVRIYLPEHMHVCTHRIRVDWINSNRYKEYRYYHVSVIQSLLLKPQSRGNSVPKKSRGALSSFPASCILLSRLRLCSTLTSELAYPVSGFTTMLDW